MTFDDKGYLETGLVDMSMPAHKAILCSAPHSVMLLIIERERPELLKKLREPSVSDYFYSRESDITWVWGGELWENNQCWDMPHA